MKYKKLIFTILGSFILLSMIPYIRAETGVIEIIDVYWGESGKEWAAMPSDRANLVIDFRSLIEGETICGLKVILWPIDPFRPFPFKGVKPGNMTAYNDQKINFGDKSQLIFDVIIDRDAKPGTYEAYLYFFYYDCNDPEYPLTMTSKKVKIDVWPLPEFRIIDVGWLNSEGFQASAGPGDSNRILSITFTVPKYYEVSNIAATLYLNKYLTNLTGGEIVRASYVGRSSEGQYFTLKFPLNIESDALLGTYDLKLVLNYYDKWLSLQSQEIPIPVTIGGSSRLDISTQSSVFTIGSISKIDIGIANTGSSPLYSVKVSLSSDALVLVGNELRVAEIGSGEELRFSFPVRVPGALSEGFYPITIQAEYVDSNGIIQTLSKIVKVEVRSPPILSLSSYVKNPEVIVGGRHELFMVVENPYDSPIRDATVKTSFESLPLSLTGNGTFYFQQIPAKRSIEFKIPVRVSPSAPTGISYGKLLISYRSISGELKTEEIPVPIIIKPDLRFEFGGITLSATSVVAGESVDVSGDVYNRGLSTGKLCEVKIRASQPLIETSDSTYYIGDISSLSKATFSASIDVANNAKPGKYAANLTISCSDAFGDVTEYSKKLEIEVAQRAAFTSTTRTAQASAAGGLGMQQLLFLQSPIAISLMTAAVVAVAVILFKRWKKREAS